MAGEDVIRLDEIFDCQFPVCVNIEFQLGTKIQGAQIVTIKFID